MFYAVTGGIVSLVQGSYEYHHYLQDGFNDSVTAILLPSNDFSMLKLLVHMLSLWILKSKHTHAIRYCLDVLDIFDIQFNTICLSNFKLLFGYMTTNQL